MFCKGLTIPGAGGCDSCSPSHLCNFPGILASNSFRCSSSELQVYLITSIPFVRSLYLIVPISFLLGDPCSLGALLCQLHEAVLPETRGGLEKKTWHLSNTLPGFHLHSTLTVRFCQLSVIITDLYFAICVSSQHNTQTSVTGVLFLPGNSRTT